jgi:hypothetical protein
MTASGQIANLAPERWMSAPGDVSGTSSYARVRRPLKCLFFDILLKSII